MADGLGLSYAGGSSGNRTTILSNANATTSNSSSFNGSLTSMADLIRVSGHSEINLPDIVGRYPLVWMEFTILRLVGSESGTSYSFRFYSRLSTSSSSSTFDAKEFEFQGTGGDIELIPAMLPRYIVRGTDLVHFFLYPSKKCTTYAQFSLYGMTF